MLCNGKIATSFYNEDVGFGTPRTIEAEEDSSVSEELLEFEQIYAIKIYPDSKKIF